MQLHVNNCKRKNQVINEVIKIQTQDIEIECQCSDQFSHFLYFECLTST